MVFKLNSRNSFYTILYLLIISDLTILLDFPIIRSIMGFFIITVIPSFLIVRVLKLDHLNLTKQVLLGIGLNLTFLMLAGLSINLLSFVISLSNPISLYPLLFIINIFIVILSYFCYNLNILSFQISYEKSDENEKILAPLLLLVHIPILSILGALEIQYYSNSVFSLIFIAFASFYIILVTFSKLIPPKVYPLSIFIIAFSLLLNRTLTSPYLFGSDIHYEYYFAQLVKNHSYWDWSLSSNINSMLSATILPNIYSILLNQDVILVYKIIYSFIFSFVPLGLYEIYNSQIGHKDAFLSTFFSMSFYAFFLVMPWLPRQEIAELFVMLIILLLFIKDINLVKKSLFFIIFISSLITSHYAMTYIFLFYLILVCGSLMLINATNTIISPSKIVLTCAMAFSWYIYISDSSTFSSMVNVVDHICSSVVGDMFSSAMVDPTISKGIGVGITDLGFLHAMGHVWFIFTEILIFSGFLYSLLKYKETKLTLEYYLFSLVSMIFIAMSIFLPYLASSLLMYRIYQITLLFLSPFCIVGIEAILKTISPILKYHMSFLQFKSLKYVLLTIILIPYFLFNTGFIYEIVEHPSSYNLDLSHIEKSNDVDYYSKWSYFTASPIPKQDVIACRWVSNKLNTKYVYVDEPRRCEITGYGMIPDTRELTPDTPYNRVVYLGYLNILNGTADCVDPQNNLLDITYNITEINPSLETRNKIYTSNGSVFYI